MICEVALFMSCLDYHYRGRELLFYHQRAPAVFVQVSHDYQVISLLLERDSNEWAIQIHCIKSKLDDFILKTIQFY